MTGRFAQVHLLRIVGFSLLVGCGAKTGLLVDASVRDIASDLTPFTDVPETDGATPACIPGHFALLRREAEVMLMFDRSGSMALNLDGSMNPPRRWDVLHDVLAATLPPIQATVDLGAIAFPRRFNGSFAGSCDPPMAVDVMPSRNNAANVLGLLANTDPWGGTPTDETLQLVGSMEVGHVSRQRSATIVLCTDGGPNCNGMLDPTMCQCTDNLPDGGGPTCDGVASNCLDDLRTVNEIQSLLMQGVPTYVIGLDADAQPAERTALSHMALAGGRPNPAPGQSAYYSARMPSSLTAAFQSIQQQVALCSFLTPSRPNDPNAVRVEVGSTSISRDTTHLDGWDWTDSTYGEITFYGAACTQVVATMSVPDVIVGCTDGG